MKSRPPRKEGGSALTACWVWDGDRWKPAWAKGQVKRGKWKGWWVVLVRVQRPNRLGRWAFGWKQIRVEKIRRV